MTQRAPRRLGYFGPVGTFTQMALRARPESAGAQEVPMPSVGAALDAVAAGEVEAAMVPIESSVEGGVSATLDALTAARGLVIVAEQLVAIGFVLAAPAGTRLHDIRAIGTYPPAWAQVRGWVAANLPEALYVPAASTAAAAEALGAVGGTARPAQLAPAGSAGSAGAAGPASAASAITSTNAGSWPAYQAAVCAPIAASVYGLQVLASGIEDSTDAVTRFVLVARPGRPPARTGADKTSVVLFQREDRPGGLLEILEHFATRGINLTRIESRPTGARLGDYCFSIDAEGHVSEERVGEALMGLRRVCADVRFLGSYPRADGSPAQVRAGNADGDFAGARTWLHSLRSGQSERPS